MKNVVYDLFTGMVSGYDRDPFPAEKSIDIPYPIKLSKTIEEKTGNMVQKVNDEGQLLYDESIFDEQEDGWYTEETTEPRKVVIWESQTHTYRVSTDRTTTETRMDEFNNPYEFEMAVYEDLIATSEVPIEWEDNEPIMVEEVISKTYAFKQNCCIFTSDEVVEAIVNTIPTKTTEELTAERVTATEDAIIMLMDLGVL
jgi:hypothetical protein